MSATVDFRRFRTWDDAGEAVQPRRAWRIVARYGIVRLTSHWTGILLLVVLAITAVTMVGTMSYAFASGDAPSADDWVGAMGILLAPLAVILLLVAAPSFSEDLRFQAPLFYFSKPLRAADYVLGKVATVGALVAGSVLAPVAIMVILAGAIGVPAAEVPDRTWTGMTAAEHQLYAQEWQAVHIDTVGDWVKATAVTVPAFLLAVAFLVSLAMAASAATRRAWHAALVLVTVLAGLAMLAGVVSEAGVHAQLLSPLGWFHLMAVVPMRLMFAPTRPGTWERDQLAELADAAPTAIPLAYVLAIAGTLGCAWFTWRRMRREEGQA